jgi:cellulose biosynthesis protein BcsQ
MVRDDISQLYKYMGMQSHDYFDFQAEDDYHNRIARILNLRIANKPSTYIKTTTPERKSKVVAVISTGHLPGRKLVSSLALLATKKLKGKVPVHVTDLIPTDGNHEEKSFLLPNGIRHILINTNEQVVRMEMSKDIDWLGRQILADNDDGIIFIDVPEQVMHMRPQAMAIADLVLVLLPATVGAIRAIEETELELKEFYSTRPTGNVGYVLVEVENAQNLPPLIQHELMIHSDLIVPAILKKETIPSARDLSAGIQTNSVEYQNLEKTINYIFEKAV